MQRLGTANRNGLLVAAFVVAAGALGWATPSLAVMDATTECLASFGGVPDANTGGGTLSCADCDPTCDTDGQTTKNNTCTFHIQACLNQASDTCEAGDLKKVKAKKLAGNCKITGLKPTASGTGSV